MNDDNVIGGLLLALLAAIAMSYLIGFRVGVDDGLEKGKNDGIVFCMEKPKECKTTYDYLKLQENQK
jgi:hypothetical protein